MSTSFSQPRNGTFSQLWSGLGSPADRAAFLALERDADLTGMNGSLRDGYWSLAAAAQHFASAPAEAAVDSAVPLAGGLAFGAIEPSPIAAAFTAGNFVVYRIGAIGGGALSGSATAVFLDEYNAAGTLVQSIALPTADNGGNQTLTASGTATSDGLMTLSADGRYLVFGGYDAAVGTATVASTTSATAQRVVGRVGADGVVDTSTTLGSAFSGGNIRSVASTDGTSFWATGSNTGVVTASLGSNSSTVVSTSTTNLRGADIYDGQLYVSSASGTLRLGTVGTGTPTTSGQTITNLPGFPTATLSPHQFFFADLTAAVAGVDTLYITDDRSVATGGGLLKYSLVSGSWVANGTASGGLTTGLRGLAGDQNGASVSFYATTTQTSANQIVSLIDTGGYNAAFSASTFAVVATAAANTVFRGIAFAPQAAAGNPGALAIADASVTEGNSGTTQISFTVTRSSGTSGAISATWTASFGASADASDFESGETFTGTVSFADGETTKTIVLDVQGDTAVEPNETFTVTLSAPTGGATLSDDSATGTINDDDAPSVTINDVSIVEGDSGTQNLVFTVTRTGGSGAFDVNFETVDGTAISTFGDPSRDYVTTSGTINFLAGQNTATISVPIFGDTLSEPDQSFQVNLTSTTNGAVIADGVGVGTITNDDFAISFIHDVQGTAYWSPILAGDGITAYNTASTTTVTIRAVVTAVDASGNRQGFYLQEELADWDTNPFTSEGIFVMTRNDSGTGSVVSGVAVGDIVTVTAQVMEYQVFSNMPRTILVNSSFIVNSTGNTLSTMTITSAPNSIMTAVTPDYTDSSDGAGDSFDAANYALSFWETVEGMLVTIPNMIVADGNVGSSGGRPYLQAYSTTLADPGQINSRGGYTIAGDPPNSPPNTGASDDDTLWGGRTVHDGDVNPDIIEVDFTDFGTTPPAGLSTAASMGDRLGDLTGIVEFDFTDRKLFVTNVGGTGFVDNGQPAIETTSLGGDSRSLTVATFNVENLGGTAAQSRFNAIADAIKNNLKSPDIICVEEIQDNNATTNDGTTDASTTWAKLVAALNAATGKVYQWVDEAPANNSDGGAGGGNIRVGFLYDTGRVQLGGLAADASLADRRKYTDRIGDGTRDAGDLIAFSDNMLGGEINASDWTTTRKSLLGEFTFNGNAVYAIANHWPSKIGSGDFWQLNQDVASGAPANSDWSQRNEIAQDVYSMMHHIQTNAANVGIVAGGDFNEFYFNRPMEVVTGYVTTDGNARAGGSRFDNLTVTELSEAERYTYVFDGRSQAIDHVVANARLSAVASYDVVHINTGYNDSGSPALSDHDPAVSSFDFRSYGETLTGTAGADSIDGFGGNDYIDGGLGADTMSGGTGVDIFVVNVMGDSVTELAGEGDDRVYASASWTMTANSHVETLLTTNWTLTGAIDLTGNSLAQTIWGNNGANTLDSGGGGDILIGYDGDDTFLIRSTADRAYENAGQGNDQALAAISWTMNAGQHIETLATTSDAGTGAIDLTGNELAQTIRGNAGSNTLDGNGGGDVLAGLGGQDLYVVRSAADQVVEALNGGADRVNAYVSWTLTAGSHVETLQTYNQTATDSIDLKGSEFNQTVYGNEGANRLDGGGGADVLEGRGGADIFAFTSAFGGDNIDSITDFLIGTDKLGVSGISQAQLAAGAFRFGAAAQDADDRIMYDPATGKLFYDGDGNGAGAAVQFAAIQTGLNLSANDFVTI